MPYQQINHDSICIGKHFPCLNGFRAISVILVIFNHVAIYFNLYTSTINPFLLKIAVHGFLGVDMFFVISGFLISGILFNDFKIYGSIRCFHFYSRRTFKIIPQYLAVIFFVCIFNPIITTSKSFPFYFYFMQNYVSPIEQLRHLWSLSVEEHFYIFLPLLLMVIYRKSKVNAIKAQIISFIVLIILGNLLRFYIWSNIGFSDTYDPYFVAMTHVRFDALIFGCLLRILYEQTWFANAIASPFIRTTLFLLSFLSFTYFYIFSFNIICWWHYTLIYVGSGCAILSALGGFPPLRIITELPVLNYIGRSSYGIYLWHFIVLFPMVALYQNYSPDPNLIYLYIVISFAVGILSTKTIERYFLDLREKLFKP